MQSLTCPGCTKQPNSRSALSPGRRCASASRKMNLSVQSIENARETVMLGKSGAQSHSPCKSCSFELQFIEAVSPVARHITVVFQLIITTLEDFKWRANEHAIVCTELSGSLWSQQRQSFHRISREAAQHKRTKREETNACIVLQIILEYDVHHFVVSLLLHSHASTSHSWPMNHRLFPRYPD